MRHGAVMQVEDDVRWTSQSQPAGIRLLARSLCEKRSKQLRQEFRADAWPSSRTVRTSSALRGHIDADSPPGGGKLDRIGQQVPHDLLQSRAIGNHRPAHARSNRPALHRPVRNECNRG